jgi:hypothetical protein
MEATARDATGESPDAVENVAKRLNRTIDNVDKILVHGSPMATATANGGASKADNGLMFALCGLFLMLGLNASLLFWINGQNTKIDRLTEKYDRMQDYLNAIYAQAPQLKPKAQEAK